MSRLNLTLDADTKTWLSKHAKGRRIAALARALLREAIERREALDRQRKLAKAYAADRGDVREVLEDLETGERELWGREDD
jgi:hypothetical protein